jgi:nucleotide-binding universal stress UspA family protein
MKTTTINRILVPADFSGSAALVMAEASVLAKLLKAEVYLLHVIEMHEFHFSLFSGNKSKPALLKVLKDGAQKKMDQIKADTVKRFGISPKSFIVTGHVHSAIIDFSVKKDIDLIIMGAHGVSGYKELFLGTNSQRVVTLSEIPVLTMQEKKKSPGFKNILIPIDNSMHSRGKVNIAMDFANLFGAKIHLIGLPDSDDKKEINKFKIKLDSVEKILQEGDFLYKTSIVHGSSLAQTALKYAAKNKCDLIVINTGHESKYSGIFLGAFAQQIVNHTTIPVLSCKHVHSYYHIDTPAFGID